MITPLPCLQKFKINKGFTLVEILVTLAIVAVFSAIGIAAYRDFSRRQVVEQAAEKIASDLRLAQNLASVQQKPAACTLTLSGYTLTFNGLNYTIYADCGVTGGVAVKSSFVSGVNLSGFTSIKFDVLKNGVDFIDSGKSQLTISFTGIGTTSIITVGPAGEITVY